MPPIRRWTCACVCLLGTVLAHSAHAQMQRCVSCRGGFNCGPGSLSGANVPDVPPSIENSIIIRAGAKIPLFQNLTLTEAYLEAKKKHRLLVIFYTPGLPSHVERFLIRCQKSPTLRAHMAWRAVAIRQNTLPKLVLTAAAQGAAMNECFNPNWPGVIVIREGMVETALSFRPDALTIPIRIQYQTEFAYDRIKARDPAWAALHEANNPLPPPPPEPEPLCTIDDRLAPIVRDPYPEEKISPLDRLEQARRMLKSGDTAGATGVYSWLWERGEQLDPAFRAARLSAVAQDMHTLQGKRDGARERFEKIRLVRTERVFWAQYPGIHEWFVLNAITMDDAATIEYLDQVINDPDEGGMLPPVESSVYRLLMRRENFAQAWERPARPVERVQEIAARLSPRFPPDVPNTERDDYVQFAHQFLIDEGSRLYTASLVAGNDKDADAIAAIVLKHCNNALARLSLITTAFAADPPQARPRQLQWLTEAEGAGTSQRPDLRTRLNLLLGPPPP